MRVCIVAEGCYPFVVGGVSSWVHSLIQLFPETEFVILAIAANRSQRGKYAYELPKNVSAVYELYLDDVDWSGSKKLHRKRLKKEQYQALRSLILDQDIEWDVLFDLFQKENVSLNALLMGEDFLNAVRDCYNLKYSQIVFSNFLWTMRSIYLPLFLTMQTEIPRADLYHCVATGYAGVLGAMAKHFYGSRLLISEHGIYTREREEELIKAKWVEGIYKNIWIDQFRKMSKLAYNEGTLITSLFEHARELQIELGCPIEKTMVTPNGIRVENLQNIPGKTEEDEGKINIGAVLRVTPIKDVKTMIQAFGFAKEKDDRLKLWIMGPWEEDREYAEECFQLVSDMEIPDVVFTGRINIRDYLGRMDVTILTSISEGQPLTILESYAAHKPVIATDVGNCYGLIYGESDDFGAAGIVTHIMNIEEIAQAMLDMAANEKMRLEMGETGYRRVMEKYRVEYMQKTYWEIYRDFAEQMRLDFQKMSIATSLLMTLISYLVSYSCYGWGIYRVWSGAISYGTMTMFLSLSGTLTGSVNSLVSLVPSAISLGISAGRLMDIVEMPQEDYSADREVEQFAEKYRASGIGLAMEDLSYTYHTGTEVFSKASLEAWPHEIIALVGPSGEGKTTMLRLILSLLRAQGGEAWIGAGEDREQRIALSPSTRKLFSYVPQGNTMFSGTIAENMRNVKPEATDEEIVEALKLACAWEFVEKLPDGIESMVKERGGGFSEGQAQRLSIARALLRKSPILLLDEATSALDVATERKVLKNIMTDTYPRTCIVTTHRPTVLGICTRVYAIRGKKCEVLGEEEILEMEKDF